MRIVRRVGARCLAVFLGAASAGLSQQTNSSSPVMQLAVTAIDSLGNATQSAGTAAEQGTIDVTARDGTWIYPLLSVRIGTGAALTPTQQAVKAELQSHFAFFQDWPDLDVNIATGGLAPPGLPLLTAPFAQFAYVSTLPLVPFESPSDDKVRSLFQPVIPASLPNSSDYSTRRWSASPLTWTTFSGQAMVQRWQSMLANSIGGGNVEVFDFEAMLHQALPYQASLWGGDVGAFLNDPSPVAGKTWYAYAVEEVGLTLQLQFVGLRSPSANLVIWPYEISTGGLVDYSFGTLPEITLSGTEVVVFANFG